jgi:hypothetical protein
MDFNIPVTTQQTHELWDYEPVPLATQTLISPPAGFGFPGSSLHPAGSQQRGAPQVLDSVLDTLLCAPLDDLPELTVPESANIDDEISALFQFETLVELDQQIGGHYIEGPLHDLSFLDDFDAAVGDIPSDILLTAEQSSGVAPFATNEQSWYSYGGSPASSPAAEKSPAAKRQSSSGSDGPNHAAFTPPRQASVASDASDSDAFADLLRCEPFIARGLGTVVSTCFSKANPPPKIKQVATRLPRRARLKKTSLQEGGARDLPGRKRTYTSDQDRLLRTQPLYNRLTA